MPPDLPNTEVLAIPEHRITASGLAGITFPSESRSITGHDLLEAGWQPGPEIGAALVAAAEYEGRGIRDKAYLLKLVARAVPKSEARLGPRGEPAPLAEAIEAVCDVSARNLLASRRTMRELLRMPVVERGALMPDACPAGAGQATIPVGGAIAVRNAIIPAAHSADICCSMFATFFRCDRGVPEMLEALMASTRFGSGGRKPGEHVHHPVLDEDVWDNPFLKGLEGHAAMHMADQGDGNHFAFLGRVALDAAQLGALEAAGKGGLAGAMRAASAGGSRFEALALVTHHGSRGLGAHLYKRGQKAAEKQTRKIAREIPPAAMWIDNATPEGADYWDALRYVARWTRANHESIHARFLEKSGSTRVCAFGNEHNFVWKRGDIFLHGKGATPAWRGEDGHPLLGLIPLHMAAPILMVLGRDNERYLSFCPHGAGRNVSRAETLRGFRNKDGEPDTARIADEIARATVGLDIRWFHGRPDLTESPVGYKPAPVVREQIERFGLADIVAEIAPLGCIMAGDPGTPPWLQRKDQLSPKQLRQIEHRADRRKTRQALGGAEGDDEKV